MAIRDDETVKHIQYFPVIYNAAHVIIACMYGLRAEFHASWSSRGSYYCVALIPFNRG